MTECNISRRLEANHNRRMANESRFLDRLDKLAERENKAEDMIGQLIRDGKIVFYAYPISGRYREGTKQDLISYLIRNDHA